MSSQNFKPVGSNIKKDPSTHVGGTYGERKELQPNGIMHEGNIQRNVDFYKVQKEATTEQFSKNAQFLGTKKVMSHTKLEKGMMHARHLISDDVRVAFLNKIISGDGISAHAENKPPAIGSSQVGNIANQKLNIQKIK
jgi:hypothetical protein